MLHDAKEAQNSVDLTLCLPHLLEPKFIGSDIAEQLLRITVNYAL